ncbi:hypothetical protein BB561_006383 [Smittium simulii]|uniref:Uncharacterized protein n=1 Tax=Smittium simulii TaxID=133385 RepID=A0A2T9Y4Y9_9FUNG|nr:hypothetical protein BB561_006383 [Smittium simulii]
MTLPISIRKKNEQYEANVKSRGKVKKSLNPKREEQIRDELTENQPKELEIPTKPKLTQNQKIVIYSILALFLSSILFQLLAPFLLTNTPALSKTKKKSSLKKKFYKTHVKAKKAAKAKTSAASSVLKEAESAKPLI